MTVADLDQLLEDEHVNIYPSRVFTNILILEKIARMCSVNDLKAFRMVSYSFYNASFPIWQEKSVLCLGPFKGWGRISMQEFMGRIKTSNISAMSFRNFKIEFGYLPPETVDDFQNQKIPEFRFWNICGGSIKSLNLHHCRFDQKALVNLLCNLVPQLESLVIQGIERAHGGRELETTQLKVQPNLKVFRVSGRLPFPNWRFLQYFPNLTEIALSKCTDVNLLQDLDTLRSQVQGRILNLKSLDLIHTEQSLQGLLTANLSLEHLSLRVDCDVQPEYLQDIFRDQCDTLQSLRVFRFPLLNWLPLSSTPLQVPFLSLKELHLWGKVVSSFNFLRWMPSLKKLVVDLLCHDRSFEIYEFCCVSDTPQSIAPYAGDMVQNANILLEANNFQHSNLEYFQMDYAFSVESVALLGQWLPQLKVLRGVFNDTTLKQVYNQWPELIALKLLYGSVVTDEGLTGLTLSSTVGHENRLANLTNLTDLKSFELECPCDTSQISDTSAHLAFLKMPRLIKLHICVSSKMTRTTEQILQEAIADVQIIRNYDEGHSHLSLACCRRADFYLVNSFLTE